MNLADITPLILTYNEQENLSRCLQALGWANQIVVVDSGSTDETLKIAQRDSRVTVHHREFEHFADQCNFGLSKVQTAWTLSLDADYICPAALSSELQSLDGSMAGYRTSFKYAIGEKVLWGTIYPPRTVLYQTHAAKYYRDGHAHRVAIDGRIGALRSAILHDDRKPMARWLDSQRKYAALEAEKLFQAAKSDLGWKDRLRKRGIIAPALTLPYCFFVKGLILSGLPGLFYTGQRVYAELLLSLELIDRRLKSPPIQEESTQ